MSAVDRDKQKPDAAAEPNGKDNSDGAAPRTARRGALTRIVMLSGVLVMVFAAVAGGRWWFSRDTQSYGSGVRRPTADDRIAGDPSGSDPGGSVPGGSVPGGNVANVDDPAVDRGVTSGHPLDPALQIARDGLANIQANVTDYTALIHKRERIAGAIAEQTMFAKIRNRKKEGDQLRTPMAVYLKFSAPESVAGREVIWVEGRNDGKLVAHEGGLKNLLRVNLSPTGFLAMVSNRYPITQIGVENLVSRLIAKGEAEREFEDTEVAIFADEEVEGRACRLIQVTHPQHREQFTFHVAQIFIDKELNLPIRYAAYSWPEQDGGEPVLLEEYTYTDVKINVGLTDDDFDPDSEHYDFP